jgi:hypothetical protein
MSFSELDESGQNFLLSLYRETNGDTSIQISMYDIGTELGLERSEASKLTEELMGWSLVELRTLSGGIAITDSAIKEIEERGYGNAGAGETTVSLGSEKIVSDEGRQAIKLVSGEIKQTAGRLGLLYETLSELMTDLKTIDTQLESTRPKTAILRECFQSIKSLLDKAGDKEDVRRIDALLGD